MTDRKRQQPKPTVG